MKSHISQSELSFLLEGFDTLLMKIYIPFHTDLAKHHTKFINWDGWRRVLRGITQRLYSPTLSLNWLNELKLISSSLTIIMRANSVIPMTFFWHSPCWFPLSRPGCRPAAAMYVLPIVLIFSMFENSGFDRSCQKKRITWYFFLLRKGLTFLNQSILYYLSNLFYFYEWF